LIGFTKPVEPLSRNLLIRLNLLIRASPNFLKISSTNEKFKMASTLEGYVNRLVSIITTDGRNFVGTLKGFDQVTHFLSISGIRTGDA
jgi:hypothetical protein